MLRLPFLIVCMLSLLCCSRLLAQEKMIQVGALTDTNNIYTLLKQAEKVRNLSLDSAIALSKKALFISRKADYPPHIVKSLLRLGAFYFEKNEYLNSKTVYKEILSSYSSEFKKDISLLPLVYNNLANIYLKQGYRDSAVHYYYQSLSAVKQIGIQNKPMLSLIYSNLGAALAIGSQRKQALYYLQEALRLTRQLGDTTLIAQNILNIGFTHGDIQEYDIALNYYRYALSLFFQKKNTGHIRSAYIKIGEAYYTIGQYQNALLYYDSAAMVNQREAMENAALQIRYGDIYKQLGNYQKAIRYYENSLKLMRKESSFLGKPIALYALAECYHALNNNTLAYKFQKAYADLKDSLMDEEKIRTINHLEVKYRTAEQQKIVANQKFLIIKQEKALLQKNTWIIVISLSSFFLLFLLFALYRNHRHKQLLQKAAIASIQQNRQIEQLQALMQGEENERNRIAQELHDGIGSLIAAARMHLDIFKGKKELPPYASSYKSGLSLLDEAYQGLRHTAHNLLPEQLFLNGFTRGIQLYCKKISKKDVFKVHCQTFANIPELNPQKALSLYRIVQELIHNALKHGQANEATVEIGTDDQHLRINVEDNGKGWEITGDGLEQGTGISNIKRRIKILGGTMEIDSRLGIGTTVYITFDLATLISDTYHQHIDDR